MSRGFAGSRNSGDRDLHLNTRNLTQKLEDVPLDGPGSAGRYGVVTFSYIVSSCRNISVGIRSIYMYMHMFIFMHQLLWKSPENAYRASDASVSSTLTQASALMLGHVSKLIQR